jgi:glycosyltransferase involved in cell wall biosynthesis
MNCLNGEQYLKQAIDSIYSQTYSNWEIIFFDNSSTDSSKEIACSYGDKITYIYSSKLLPLGSARKEAVRHARGEWIGFLDTDDLWYPDKLNAQIAMATCDSLALIYSGIDNVDINGVSIARYKPISRRGMLLDHLLNQFDINMVTPLVNRQFLLDHDITFNDKIHASEEYNLFLRIAAKGIIKSTSDVHGAYRVYEGSLTDKKMDKWAIDRLVTLRQLNRENKKLMLYNNPRFIKAKMHARYYSARYYMSVGNIRKAKLRLSSIRYYRLSYFFLWVLAHSPRLWNMIHKRSIKAYISKYFTK